jgi:hypothetical protein
LFRDGFCDLNRQDGLSVPGGQVEVIDEDGDIECLDGQDDVALDGLETEQLLCRIGRRRLQQFLEPVERLRVEAHMAQA